MGNCKPRRSVTAQRGNSAAASRPDRAALRRNRADAVWALLASGQIQMRQRSMDGEDGFLNQSSRFTLDLAA